MPGVGGIPTYNAQTGTVTFTPNTGFIGAATFTYRITDGTNDPASASVNLTVLPPASTQQLFAYSDTPAILSDPDPNSVNLGVKFLATEGGAITGLKYYKGAGDTGTHVGSLWTSTGTLLASATFTNESASGWQYVTFDNPVSISAGTTYVASYHSNGHYTATGNYFTSAYTNGSLATPGPAAGVYAYGASDLFPTSTSSANYWVDVLFAPSGAPIAVNDNGFTTTKGTALSIHATTASAQRHGSERRSAFGGCGWPSVGRDGQPCLECCHFHADTWLYWRCKLHLSDHGRHPHLSARHRRAHRPAGTDNRATICIHGRAGEPLRPGPDQRQSRREVRFLAVGLGHRSQVLQGNWRYGDPRRIVVEPATGHCSPAQLSRMRQPAVGSM